MAIGPKAVFRDVTRLFSGGVVGTLSDAQLLERFLAGHRDAAEDAFAAVVEQHRADGVSRERRILMDSNDADDAFQVTFLVLAGAIAGARAPATGFTVSPSAPRRTSGKAPLTAPGVREASRQYDTGRLYTGGGYRRTPWHDR